MKMTVPFSTQGSSASCCALFQRCTSSTKRMVRWPYMPRALLRLGDGLADVRHARQHGVERDKVGAGGVGDDLRQGGLAGAGRAVEDQAATAGRPGWRGAAAARGRRCAPGPRTRPACAGACAPPAGASVLRRSAWAWSKRSGMAHVARYDGSGQRLLPIVPSGQAVRANIGPLTPCHTASAPALSRSAGHAGPVPSLSARSSPMSASQMRMAWSRPVVTMCLPSGL